MLVEWVWRGDRGGGTASTGKEEEEDSVPDFRDMVDGVKVIVVVDM